jgi:MFS family permease
LTSNEKKTLALTGVGHFGCHIAMLVFPTAAVIMAQTTGMKKEEIYPWGFLCYLLFGICALPIGLLADRLRANWGVKLGALGVGPALMLVALADPTSRFELTAGLALVGVMASIYHPTGMSLLSKTMTRRGTSLGLNAICGSAGIALSPILTEMTAIPYGWRGSFVILGLMLLALGIPVSLLKIDESPSREATETQAHGQGRLDLFCVLLVAMMLGGLSYRANALSLPGYLEERQSSETGFGIVTGLLFFVGSIGQMLGGRLADRYDLRFLYMVFHLVSIPFALAMYSLMGAPLYAAAGVFIFCNLGMQPIENSLVARLTPERLRTTAYGVKFIFVFGCGSFAVLGVPWIIKAYSFAHVYLAIAAVVAMMFLAICVLTYMSRGKAVMNADHIVSNT